MQAGASPSIPVTTGLSLGRLARLALVALQLGLVVALVRLFDIEDSVGFSRLTPILLVGFIVHALAPATYRRPIFLLVSLVAIEAIFPFPNSLVLVGIGLVLIGCCHLPVPYVLRVALIVTLAIVLGLFRAEVLPSPLSTLGSVVIPMLGAMFMFRLVVYLYDIRHMKKKVSVWDRLSYFFLLPNVCFPLFPVVDFQTYLRTYFDKEDIQIYQKGVLWMFRGLTHLLVYRVVYHYMMPNPEAVDGLFQVLSYMLATYLLYLRISGQFHMIVGILCLFGYNLPETHHLYYLASSFNDYWRRINIYWKDFMMKIFFYPSFMRLRKLGTTPALVLSTLIVFAGTWILHSYQWFWLQGSFPITLPDALFWGILGLLVAGNSVWESKRPKKKLASKKTWNLRAATIYSLKVLGMFVLITTLWTLWSSETVTDFAGLLQTAAADGPLQWLAFLAILAGLVLVGIFAQFLIHRGWELTITGSAPSFRRSAAYTTVAATLLIVAGMPQVVDRSAPAYASFIGTIKSEHLNQRDEELLARGYYEGLLAADKYTSALAVIQNGRPPNWEAIMESEAVNNTPDVLQYHLVPNLDLRFKNAPFRTNSWGMRDREYSLQKPQATTRIAFLGASYEMGAGVPREATFEALVEQKLNEGNDLGSDAEILNFSVGGYSLLHNVILMEDHVFRFDPDAILVAVHTTEARRMATHLASLVQERIDVSAYPVVERVLAESGADPSMSRSQIRTRITPLADQVVEWSLRRIAELSLERGLVPVVVYVPLTEEVEGFDEEIRQMYTQISRDAGFEMAVLDHAFDGRTQEEIQLAPWDTHLGKLGHELVATRLYSEFAGRPELIRSTRTPNTSNTPKTN